MLALRSKSRPVYSAPSYFACDDPIRYDPFDENRALSYAAAVLPVVMNGTCRVEEGPDQDRVERLCAACLARDEL